jgi:glycosyltransferase involved in cell wall biosynthesis
MRIAQIATMCTPVRQIGSDSIEGLVWLLTRELTRLGHEVTVFAAPGSEIDGELVTTLPGTYAANGSPGDWQICELINLCRAVEQSGQFDVLHSHNYFYGLLLQALSKAPIVNTFHLNGSEEYAGLWKQYPDACVIAISKYQWSAFPQFNPADVIYHGVDSSQFTFQPHPEDYVCYLGRFTPGKGPLQAIAAAKSLGIRLVLAGPRNQYYDEYIAPLVDGKFIQHVGSVSGSTRDRILGQARALLYPVQYPEPFGLVMVEAMMCGTPVAAINIGAVPEIINQGVTGFYSETSEEFTQSLEAVMNLDRKKVHQQASLRFSSERMALDYVKVYNKVVSMG